MFVWAAVAIGAAEWDIHRRGRFSNLPVISRTEDKVKTHLLRLRPFGNYLNILLCPLGDRRVELLTVSAQPRPEGDNGGGRLLSLTGLR